VTSGEKRPAEDLAVVGRGMQPAHVRQINQRAILSLIFLEPGISNAELARLSHLAPQTVSSVLDDLARHHLITRGAARRGRRGQPATPVFLNPGGAFAIGAGIGWRQLEVCLVGIGGTTLARFRRSYAQPEPATVLAALGAGVAEVTAGLSAAERARVTGLGLAVPRWLGGAAEAPAGAFAEIDLGRAAAEASGLRTALYHDGTAACWAERVAQPRPRPPSFVFLLVDTQVAGGIVAENRLWQGGGAAAGLGAMRVVDRQGNARSVHETASLHALQQRLVAHGLAPDAIAAPAAVPVVSAWVEDAGFAFAQVVLSTAAMLEHRLAVIDSAMPAAVTAALVAATARQVSAVPGVDRRGPRIVAGQLGRSGVAEGAGLLRLYRRFFSRELAHLQGEARGGGRAAGC
jgi:predicted NBD/HSP70 family sugar kinase